jgi:hypothetical protein
MKQLTDEQKKYLLIKNAELLAQLVVNPRMAYVLGSVENYQQKVKNIAKDVLALRSMLKK